MGDMSGNGSAMTGEPKTAEEALALHKELMERENAILSENAELWEKVFMEADKGMAMIEDGKNYGDFLLDTVEAIKEKFTDKEYEWLKESATEISNIENKLTELEEKYPEVMQKSMDGDMSMPAGSDMSNPPDDGSMQKFPAFEGKDLDGNAVKSDELFSGNAATVVNFWFTTCNPCVGGAFRAGRSEQGTRGEGRHPHRSQHIHAGRRRGSDFGCEGRAGQEGRYLSECVF